MQDTGCLGLVHGDDPEGWHGEGGGGGCSGLGTRVHPWRIHADVWQNQYNIVKFKKKEREMDPDSNLKSAQLTAGHAFPNGSSSHSKAYISAVI